MTEGEPDPQAQVEQKFIVQFVAGRDLMSAIEQVRALLSFRLPADAPLEDLLAIVTEEFINRHSPDRRRELRRERDRKRTRGANGERSEDSDHAGRNKNGQQNPSNPRHVPRAVRDEVFSRAGGRCTYTGPYGTRCNATRHLQIDHIVPVARGGNGASTNLRILCAAHNRLEAERILGFAAMGQHRRRE